MARKTTRVIEVVIAAKDLASRTMKSALGKISKGFNAMKKVVLLTAAAIAGVGVALFTLANKLAATGDEFNKMALRTGIAVEVLSGFKFAAEIAGASIEDFEKGMKTLSKRISDARFGLETYQRIFRELGIDYQTASGALREVDVVFLDAAEAINKLSSETEKAAFAQELFGRAGTQLLPLIKEGKAGIQDLIDKNKELGGVWTTLEAEKAADFKDALTEIKTSFGGLAKDISLKLIPAFTQLFEKVTDFITKGRTIPAVINAITTAIRPLASILGIDTRTALEKVNAELAFMNTFESFQFFETGITHAAEMNRLLARQAELIREAGEAQKERNIIDLGPPKKEGMTIVEMAEREQLAKMEIALFERSEAAFEASAGRRLAIERNLQNQIMGFKFAAANQAAALLSILGTKNKAAALAALAFQKGIAIAQVFIQTKAAAALAQATVPPPAGQVLAASILAWGRVQMGLIAATGIAQLAGAGGGGPSGIGGGGGVGALPIVAPTTEPQEAQLGPVTIIINTPTGDIPDDTIDRLVEGINNGSKRNIFVNFAEAIV